MSDIRQAVLAQMASVFGIGIADIPENAAPGIVEQWDSLRHMQLIVALEETFKIRFADTEMNTLIGVPQIIQTVSRKTGK